MSAPVPSSSRVVRVLVPVAAVVIVACVLGLFLLSDDRSPRVGDCVGQGSDGDVAVVDCDDSAATFEVIGVLDDIPPVDSQPACLAAFPRTTASYSDGGLSAEPGRVLCLVAA